MVLRIPGPQQTQSGPLNPCEIYMSLYGNSTVEPIMRRTLFTSSQLVSLNLNRSFYSVISHPPSAFPRRIYHSRPLPLVQIKPSTAACTYPIPLASLYSVRDTCSVTSNIFAIAFVLMTCTHILTWSTSSYDLNPVLRRKLSISVGPLVCYPS